MRATLARSILVLLWLAAAGGGALAAGKGLRLLDQLPRDPLLASVATVDDLPEMLDRWLGWAERLGAGGGAAQGLAEFEQKLGCSIRGDLLARIGPEVGFVLDLPPIDTLVAGLSDPATGIPQALGGVGVVAQVREAEALDRCLRLLFTLGDKATIKEAEGLVEIALPFGAADAPTASLFYGFRSGLFALGASADFVTAALAPRLKGERLTDGADFARIVANLDAAPESLTYVNLPKLREMVQASATVRGLISASDDVRPILDLVLSPEFTAMGIGTTSVEVKGGTRTTSFGPSGLSGSAAAGGVLASIALPNLLNATDRGKQKRSMADIRSLGTAIEAFSIDNNVYPGPTGGWVPVTEIESSLAPAYIRALPATDGWGNPLMVWSDGQHYAIVSPGKDGELERDWSGAESGEGGTSSFGADIVFADGSFIQWPEGKQE